MVLQLQWPLSQNVNILLPHKSWRLNEFQAIYIQHKSKNILGHHDLSSGTHITPTLHTPGHENSIFLCQNQIWAAVQQASLSKTFNMV